MRTTPTQKTFFWNNLKTKWKKGAKPGHGTGRVGKRKGRSQENQRGESGKKEAPSDDTKLNLSQTRRSLDSDSDEEHFNNDGYVSWFFKSTTWSYQ